MPRSHRTVRGRHAPRGHEDDDRATDDEGPHPVDATPIPRSRRRPRASGGSSRTARVRCRPLRHPRRRPSVALRVRERSTVAATAERKTATVSGSGSTPSSRSSISASRRYWRTTCERVPAGPWAQMRTAWASSRSGSRDRSWRAADPGRRRPRRPASGAPRPARGRLRRRRTGVPVRGRSTPGRGTRPGRRDTARGPPRGEAGRIPSNRSKRAASTSSRTVGRKPTTSASISRYSSRSQTGRVEGGAQEPQRLAQRRRDAAALAVGPDLAGHRLTGPDAGPEGEYGQQRLGSARREADLAVADVELDPAEEPTTSGAGSTRSRVGRAGRTGGTLVVATTLSRCRRDRCATSPL